MAVSVALPLTHPVPRHHLVTWRRRCRASVVIRLSDVARSSQLTRLATPGLLLYCSVFPAVQVGLIAEGWGDGTWGDALWALVATACYLPLHLRHVLYAARGSRAPWGEWTLLAMTAVVLGVLPVLGSVWLPTLHVVVVSALIVLRRPWSVLVCAGVVAAQAPLAHALDDPLPDGPYYYTVTLLWRASAVFLPVWLLGAVRQLQAAREALAEEAVVRERLRIDGELRLTLGTALDAIAGRGERAGTLVGGDRGALEDELQALVDGSRRTLARARQMISGYQRPSLRSELDSAVSLLNAGGIRARLVLPTESLPDSVDESLRSELRSATARLLRDDTTVACVVTVSSRDGRVRLEVHPDDTAPATRKVPAP
jgi:two-component system sensor histidine kinase DesK